MIELRAARTAKSAITENNGVVTISDRLTQKSATDVWKLTARTTGSRNFNLNGLAKKSNADLEILNAQGQVIAASRKKGNQAEQLNNLAIAAGTFYVRVKLQRGSAKTNYVVTMTPNPAATVQPSPTTTPVVTGATPSSRTPVSTIDQFGNSFDQATSLELTQTTKTIEDAVSTTDQADFFKLKLTQAGQLNLSLTGLSDNADIELYDKNQVLLARVNNEAANSETLIQRITEIGVPYYLKIQAAPNSNTNYTLKTSFTSDSVTTTSTGLKYSDLAIGNGATPTTGKFVVVNYTGVLENGEKFDSSRDRTSPFQFQIGQGRVIAGWDEGISTMKVGGRRQLIIPSNLAYGAEGRPGSIPPNATLFFDVEVLAIGS